MRLATLSHPIPTKRVRLFLLREKLIYRGTDIKDIVNGSMSEGRFGFEEVTYLFLFGELPDINELNEFRALLSEYRKLPLSFVEDAIMKTSEQGCNEPSVKKRACTIHPMMSRQTTYRSSNVIRQCLKLIAQIPAGRLWVPGAGALL